MVELPFRDMDLPYHDLLREAMAKRGFVILEEGEESGFDDWEGAWCEKMGVICWWSVWGWSKEKTWEAKEEKKKKKGKKGEKLDSKEGETEEEVAMDHAGGKDENLNEGKGKEKATGYYSEHASAEDRHRPRRIAQRQQQQQHHHSDEEDTSNEDIVAGTGGMVCKYDLTAPLSTDSLITVAKVANDETRNVLPHLRGLKSGASGCGQL